MYKRQPQARRGDATLHLKPGEELVAFAGVDQAEVRLQAAEVVFVGFGIQAAAERWDELERRRQALG